MASNSIFQRNPILPEMSLAYEGLSSTGTSLSIFPLANDYLMSGHCERATARKAHTPRGGTGMKYMLLIYGDENGLSETERKDCYVESTKLAHQLHSNGQYVAANPLHPTTMAASVRVRDNTRLVTDGRFAEPPNNLAGTFSSRPKTATTRSPSQQRFPWPARALSRSARSSRFRICRRDTRRRYAKNHSLLVVR